ncbi:DHH family phosphoesterase [Candidatus Woesearchaeota archaeon]|nr:DHH family phosphoesterase [Candidatus Woesearchaeota archaeon]
MDNYSQFKEYMAVCLEKFKEIDRKETIRLVSHLDADGICACSIMVKALNTDNRKYSLSIVQQLTDDVILGLSKEPYEHFIFTDLGSGQLSFLKKHLFDRQVIVLDHHEPEKIKLPSSFVHVNPHLFGIDGGKEISGAGVVYLFVKGLNKAVEDLAGIALVGATGDVQEDGKGFLTLNKEILDIAVRNGKVKVITGLRIFGAQTRPLHKVLEYCTDPFIPGVSGSESGAIQFLHETGIQAKNGNEWRKIVHLDQEEIKKLVSGIIIRRLGEEKPEDVLGNVYILNEEEKESPFRDMKEFSTLLNACGRLDKASLGIGACLGDKKAKERAMASLVGYKKMIINAMRWFDENKDGGKVMKGDGYLIINAGSDIKASMIGTMASILSKSTKLRKGTFIMSMADLLDGNYKVSLRMTGRNGIDLRDVIKRIAEKAGGEAGGHMYAAGAMIKGEKVEDFMKEAQMVLESRAREEVVN